MSATQTKYYDDLLTGQYWELYKLEGYDPEDPALATREPIGYLYAGVTWNNDVGDMEANPGDSGVIQQGFGKSQPGLDFTGMTPYGDTADDSYLKTMELMTADGVMIGKAEWEAAEVWVYDDDPSMGSLDITPRQICQAPRFGVSYEDIEQPEDGFGEITFTSYMNGYPRFILEGGEAVPTLDGGAV